MLIRRFDERAGWLGWGFDRCADWLHWRCDISKNAAREKVRVAHALKTLPAIAMAFARGELSYSKVRALKRVANSDDEEALLEFALRTTAARVEERCRELRCGTADSRDEAMRAHTHRYLSLRRDPERGVVTITVELPIETGDDAGDPLNIGRKSRIVPAPIRRALQARDRCCRFPGCACRRFLHAHHVEHWAAGGETGLLNLILLCPEHHWLVHEGGFTIEKDYRDRWFFRRPDGRAVPACGYRADDMRDDDAPEAEHFYAHASAEACTSAETRDVREPSAGTYAAIDGGAYSRPAAWMRISDRSPRRNVSRRMIGGTWRHMARCRVGV